MTKRFSDFGQNEVFSAFSYFLSIFTIFIAKKKAPWSDSVINRAKYRNNNVVFLNFIADMLGSRDVKISDNFFLSLNFSKLAHVRSLKEGIIEGWRAELMLGEQI